MKFTLSPVLITGCGVVILAGSWVTWEQLTVGRSYPQTDEGLTVSSQAGIATTADPNRSQDTPPQPSPSPLAEPVASSPASPLRSPVPLIAPASTPTSQSESLSSYAMSDGSLSFKYPSGWKVGPEKTGYGIDGFQSRRLVRVEKPYKGSETRQIIDFYTLDPFVGLYSDPRLGGIIETVEQYAQSTMSLRVQQSKSAASPDGQRNEYSEVERVTLASGLTGYTYSVKDWQGYHTRNILFWQGNALVYVSQTWGYWQTWGAKDPKLEVSLETLEVFD